MNTKNNSTITVSVITPSYNQGIFIEETIKSVLFQKGNFYIEYIIIDGGSTDNTISIIKKYDELVKNNEMEIYCLGIKFLWISEKDNGQSHAINKGLTLSSGSLLTYLNSDDCFNSDTIINIIIHFKDLNKDYIFHGGAEYIDIDSKYLYTKKSKPFSLPELFFQSYIIQPGSFFSRSLINKIGFYNEKFVFAFDYDFFYRAYNNCEYIFVDKVLAKVRLHSSSKTSTIISRCESEMLKILETFFLRNDISKDLKKNKENAIIHHAFMLLLMANKNNSHLSFFKSLILLIRMIRSFNGFLFLLKKILKKINNR